MLNCCVTLGEVDNDGIPSFPTDIQSCSGGKKSLKKLQLGWKNSWSLSCKVNSLNWSPKCTELVLLTG